MGARLLTGLLFVAGCSSACDANIRGPLDPWQWSQLAIDVAVFTIGKGDTPDTLRVVRTWPLQGADGIEGAPAFRTCLQELSSGVVEAWGAYLTGDALPDTYLCFVGDRMPGGAQIIPVASRKQGLDVLGTPAFGGMDLPGKLRAVLFEALTDPDDAVAVTAGDMLLRCPAQPDAAIEAAVERLADRPDVRAKTLALCCRALYGDATQIPQAVELWKAHERGAALIDWYVDIWVREAIRSSSQADALPVLAALLGDRAASQWTYDVFMALAGSGLPDAMPLLVTHLASADERVCGGAVGALSRLTLRYNWGLLVTAPEGQRREMAERWRTWWEREGAPAFVPTEAPPQEDDPVGDPMRLLQQEAEWPGQPPAAPSLREIASSLAEQRGVLIALDASLDPDRPLALPAPDAVRTVEDLLQVVVSSVGAEACVWESGIALAPQVWRPSFRVEAERRARAIETFLGELTAARAESVAQCGALPANALSAVGWQALSEVGTGSAPPLVDGTSLLDMPREALLARAEWEIRFDVDAGEGKPYRLYFGHGNLSGEPLEQGSLPFASLKGGISDQFPLTARAMERMGQELMRPTVTDHSRPYWQVRFAAATAAQMPPPVRPVRAAQPLLPVQDGPVTVSDLAAAIAKAEGLAEARVDPKMASTEVLLLGPPAATTPAHVKLAVAGVTHGGWRQVGDVLQLDPLSLDALSQRAMDSLTRLCAPALADLCLRYDPALYSVWRYYAAVGRNADAGQLPLALQQPVRLGLWRSQEYTEAYRSRLWRPWNDGSVRVTPRLVTELFVAHADPDALVPARWGAVWEEPTPGGVPIDILPTREEEEPL